MRPAPCRRLAGLPPDSDTSRRLRRRGQALRLATEALRCSRHQESTRLRCVECEAPICPRCLVRTEVGMRCEECAKPAVVVPPEAPAKSHRTPVVMAITGVVLLVAVAVAFASRGSGGEKAGPPPPLGSWVGTPSLATIRGTATVVVLRDGQALVAGGGVGGIALAASEVFEPGRGAWRPRAPMHQARRGHQAVLLKDGRVLVAGGLADGKPLASAEVYDPGADLWTLMPPMSSARLGSSLTVLADGRVLAAGGTGDGLASGDGGQALGPLASAEIFDPAAGTWAPTRPMTSSRFEHTATVLEDGRVLMAGGLGGGGAEPRPLASTEMFDPAASSFVRSGDLLDARTNHGAVLLPDHSVLVAGGVGIADVALGSAEIFDAQRGSWSRVDAMAQARTGETATALADGQVLVVGGESVEQGSRRSLATAEVFDPAGRTWRSAGQMRCPRSEEAAALLGDASVLVVAGDAAFPGQAPMAQSCADRYQPAATRAR